MAVDDRNERGRLGEPAWSDDKDDDDLVEVDPVDVARARKIIAEAKRL